MHLIKQRHEHITISARFHFLIPGIVGFTLAPGTVDKPAHIPGLKFIGWAPGHMLFRAIQKVPALFFLTGPLQDTGDQEIDMPLHMARDFAPSLLIAVYCFNGYTQKLGHLFLGTP
jgi:hypothetical protein